MRTIMISINQSRKLQFISQKLLIITKQRKETDGKEKKEMVQSGASGSGFLPLPSCITYSAANMQIIVFR